MARKPRVIFPGAIYHVVTRGDGRQLLFHDDRHYQRFTEGLEAEVLRSGWQVIAFCWMPNHIHALLKTPEPNLANGMQHWLSGYANWYAKRNQRTGHLYQGRYKAFQVQDSSYFWTLSRYIHLNLCVGKKPLTDKPQDRKHSSYPSYIYKNSSCRGSVTPCCWIAGKPNMAVPSRFRLTDVTLNESFASRQPTH